MKFYCEECEATYEDSDLNKRYYENIEELCFECPECENMNLVAIAQETSLALSWNGEDKKINVVEYDNNTKIITKSNAVMLSNIAKVILHHMNCFGERRLKISGLDIRKNC